MKLGVLFLALCLSVQAQAIREVRNGGGGMRSDAGIETFLSANLYLVEKPEAPQEIPGLTRLMAELAAMPIKESIKGQLFSAIYPTLTRNYYRVKDNAISETTRKSIIEKYALMTHIPASKVVLLAASGWDSQTTVLFKEFYELKVHEQAAILFHEALWLLKPELTYEQVVAVEQEAQKFFQNHGDKQAYYSFLMKLSEIFNDNNFYLFPLLSEDFQTDVFHKSSDGVLRVSLVDLFGPSFVDSILLHDFSTYKLRYTEIAYVQSTNQVIAYNAALMAVAKPGSLFYPGLLQYITKYGFIDLLPQNRNEGHLSYTGLASMYPDFRDHLYIVVPKQMFGEHIYLDIYDKTDAVVGRLYLK